MLIKIDRVACFVLKRLILMNTNSSSQSHCHYSNIKFDEKTLELFPNYSKFRTKTLSFLLRIAKFVTNMSDFPLNCFKIIYHGQ